VYADDVNINTIKKNRDALLEDSMEAGLRVNTGKTKYNYMVTSRHQDARQNHNLPIDNKVSQM